MTFIPEQWQSIHDILSNANPNYDRCKQDESFYGSLSEEELLDEEEWEHQQQLNDDYLESAL